MKLWLLTRTDKIGYDEYVGFVIRASSHQQARKIAREYEDRFSSPKWKVTAVKVDGKPGCILAAFNTG